MLVRFTNIHPTEQIALAMLAKTLSPGEFVDARRTAAQLDAERSLKQLVVAGKVSLAYTVEAEDLATGFMSNLRQVSNATRPAANTVPIFTAVYNTDDNAANWSDSLVWRDSAGVIT